MIYRNERFLEYKQSDLVPELSYLDDMTAEDIDSLFHEVLSGGIHGFCFGAFDEGQETGPGGSEKKIRQQLKILQPYTDWIRILSCTGSNALIPSIAKDLGLKTLVGARLDNDKTKNEQEIKSLIQLAKGGYVDIAAVGAEVLFQGELDENQLLDYIDRVARQIPSTPVGYVDTYYEFLQRPAIIDACDIILCNCHPFWEGTHFNHSFQHIRQMYYGIRNIARGKKVIIAETGWPNGGLPLGEAVPTRNNAMKYFINTNLWSQDENIDVFYFSSFDQSREVADKGITDAFWGVWDHDGNLKY